MPRLVLLLAGSGRRFGAQKQFLELAGVPVWRRALAVFTPRIEFEAFALVVPAGEESRIEAEARPLVGARPLRVVAGGAERYLSVLAGLEALGDFTGKAWIHDAARPALHADDVSLLLDASVSCAEGILPGGPLADTIKRVDADGFIAEHLERAALRAVSTPQIFDAKALREAYRSLLARTDHRTPTDDAEVWGAAGGRVRIVDLARPNPKITRPEDLVLLRDLTGP